MSGIQTAGPRAGKPEGGIESGTGKPQPHTGDLMDFSGLEMWEGLYAPTRCATAEQVGA